MMQCFITEAGFQDQESQPEGEEKTPLYTAAMGGGRRGENRLWVSRALEDFETREQGCDSGRPGQPL